MKSPAVARILLCFALWALSVHAQISSPSSSAVWTEGENGTITWQGISGAPLCVVLTRANTAYHHTITCTAQSSGTLSWTVDLPASDGWPTSSSADLVYRIDFYTGGGWNLGGQLVTSSSQFAIVYTGVNNPTGAGTTTVIVPTTPGPGYITETITQVLVGVITSTQYITEVVQVTYVNPTGTVVVVQPTVGIVTLTITNTNQLSTITQVQTTGTSTTTTFVGATTITGQVTVQQVVNSGTKEVVGLRFVGIMLLALMSAMLVWG